MSTAVALLPQLLHWTRTHLILPLPHSSALPVCSALVPVADAEDGDKQSAEGQQQQQQQQQDDNSSEDDSELSSEEEEGEQGDEGDGWAGDSEEECFDADADAEGEQQGQQQRQWRRLQQTGSSRAAQGAEQQRGDDADDDAAIVTEVLAEDCGQMRDEVEAALKSRRASAFCGHLVCVKPATSTCWLVVLSAATHILYVSSTNI